MSAITFVNAALVVVRGLEQLGLSMSQLDAAVKKARAAGRDFTIEDMEPFKVGAADALKGLDDAITAAQAPPTPKPAAKKTTKKKTTKRNPDVPPGMP